MATFQRAKLECPFSVFSLFMFQSLLQHALTYFIRIDKRKYTLIHHDHYDDSEYDKNIIEFNHYPNNNDNVNTDNDSNNMNDDTTNEKIITE